MGCGEDWNLWELLRKKVMIFKKKFITVHCTAGRFMTLPCSRFMTLPCSRLMTLHCNGFLTLHCNGFMTLHCYGFMNVG